MDDDKIAALHDTHAARLILAAFSTGGRRCFLAWFDIFHADFQQRKLDIYIMNQFQAMPD